MRVNRVLTQQEIQLGIRQFIAIETERIDRLGFFIVTSQDVWRPFHTDELSFDLPTSETLRLITDAIGASFDMFQVYVVQDMANKKGFHVEVKPRRVS